MRRLKSRAFARAGFLGNPSDGYHGKTISFIVRDFRAEVILEESKTVVFKSSGSDALEFESLTDCVGKVRAFGWDGGIRLLKSAAVQFHSYCELIGRGDFSPFSVSFESNIPRQVGLAGSSAIVTAMLRGLSRWHGIEIEPSVLATLALNAEQSLGISAGLQDRVIQAYEGMVYMDFSKDSIQTTELGFEVGGYSKIAPELLENTYIAYATNCPESTEVLHSDLKKKYDAGDQLTRSTLNEIAGLAEQGRMAILAQDRDGLSELINRNFDLRQKICLLNPFHVQMIQLARQNGATAKYCGSGGAIVGTYSDESAYKRLVDELATIGCHVFKPNIASVKGES